MIKKLSALFLRDLLETLVSPQNSVLYVTSKPFFSKSAHFYKLLLIPHIPDLCHWRRLGICKTHLKIKVNKLNFSESWRSCSSSCPHMPVLVVLGSLRLSLPRSALQSFSFNADYFYVLFLYKNQSPCHPLEFRFSSG